MKRGELNADEFSHSRRRRRHRRVLVTQEQHDLVRSHIDADRLDALGLTLIRELSRRSLWGEPAPTWSEAAAIVAPELESLIYSSDHKPSAVDLVPLAHEVLMQALIDREWIAVSGAPRSMRPGPRGIGDRS